MTEDLSFLNSTNHSMVSSGLISLGIPKTGENRHENISFRKSATYRPLSRLTAG